MTPSMHIDMGDVDGLADALLRAPSLIEHTIIDILTQSGFLLQRETVERAPVGVGGGGGLRGSIAASRPVRLGVSSIAIGVGSALDYAEPVELGTRPHMPPIEPLVDWVEAKTGKTGEAARSMAWAVAFKIKTHGTEGVHMFGQAFEANQVQVQRIANVKINQAIRSLGQPLGGPS